MRRSKKPFLFCCLLFCFYRALYVGHTLNRLESAFILTGGNISRGEKAVGSIQKPDPKKVIVSFRNFLGQIGDVISQTMVISPDPQVIMVQAPRFCDQYNERAFTKALVEIAGVRYPVDIIANFYYGTIAIISDVFGVLVKYDFENGKIINVEPYPPTPEILKGYCFGIRNQV